MANHLKSNQPEKKSVKAAVGELKKTSEKKFRADAKVEAVYPTGKFSLELILTAGCILLLIVCNALDLIGYVRYTAYVALFIAAGYAMLMEAAKAAFAGNYFNTSIIFTVVSVAALCTGNMEGAVVMAIVFRILQDAIIYRTHKTDLIIAEIASVLPASAVVDTDSGFRKLPVKTIKPGDRVFVEPGEIIPVDGFVTEGITTTDAGPLCGKITPRSVKEGDMVYAGERNLTESIQISVTESARDVFAQSLIESAEGTIDGHSDLYSRGLFASKYVTPGIMIVGILYFVISGIRYGDWIGGLNTSFIFFVAASMSFQLWSIAAPFSYGAALNAGYGVIFKKSFLLEALAKVKTLVLTKTGIVTDPEYQIMEIRPVKGMSEYDILTLANAAESDSNHPVARAIRKAAQALNIQEGRIVEVEEQSGRGITTFIDEHRVCVGNAEHMLNNNITFPVPNVNGTCIHVSVDDSYCGCIVMKERIKNGAFEALDDMRLQGVSNMIMLTGDSRVTARQIASSLNMDMVKAELTRDMKKSAFDYLKTGKQEGTNIAFVGNGIQDDYLMASADVGIALNVLGDRESLENSDIGVIGNDLTNISAAYVTSGRAARIAFQNFVISGILIAVLVVFSLLKIMPLSVAAIIYGIVLFLEILNTSFVGGYPDLISKRRKGLR